MGRGVGPRVGLLDEPLVAPARSDGLVPARRGVGRVAVAHEDGVVPVGVDGRHRRRGVHGRAGVVGPAGDLRSAAEVVGVHVPRHGRRPRRPVARRPGWRRWARTARSGCRGRSAARATSGVAVKPAAWGTSAAWAAGAACDGGGQDQGGGGGSRPRMPEGRTSALDGSRHSSRVLVRPAAAGHPACHASARARRAEPGKKQWTPHSQSIGTAALRLERSTHRVTTETASASDLRTVWRGWLRHGSLGATWSHRGGRPRRGASAGGRGSRLPPVRGRSYPPEPLLPGCTRTAQLP